MRVSLGSNDGDGRKIRRIFRQEFKLNFLNEKKNKKKTENKISATRKKVWKIHETRRRIGGNNYIKSIRTIITKSF